MYNAFFSGSWVCLLPFFLLLPVTKLAQTHRLLENVLDSQLWVFFFPACMFFLRSFACGNSCRPHWTTWLFLPQSVVVGTVGCYLLSGEEKRTSYTVQSFLFFVFFVSCALISLSLSVTGERRRKIKRGQRRCCTANWCKVKREAKALRCGTAGRGPGHP